ncbi:hypothetical protein [Enterococcus sp. AZ072]|uniref:hypothetical protein n=1 Tax=unclassified Enterococcus TaxID=2608891 RepID=UPI003D2D21C4
MSQRDKRRHLFHTFVRSKGLFAFFSLLLSLLLVTGSTYAWITSNDERVNRTEANQRKLSAKIDGNLDMVRHFAPGTKEAKEIRVTNNGEVPAIVRLSLTESFVSFETDVKDNHSPGNGNGDLMSYGTPVLPVISLKDTSTWIVGKTYEISANKHYKANHVLKDLPYVYQGTRPEPMPAIQLNFTSGKVFDSNTQPSGTDSAYWYYENGFFYYSEVLKAGESSTSLLTSVTLNPAYLNQYKGAFYKLVPEMDAHDITRELYSDWGISSTDFAYNMYQDQLYK